MKDRFCALLLTLFAAPCFGACEKKEYAEYKDMARNASGQTSLAHQYCTFYKLRGLDGELADLEMKAGRLAAAKIALASAEACLAEMSKISNALNAAKASRANALIVKTCGPSAK